MFCVIEENYNVNVVITIIICFKIIINNSVDVIMFCYFKRLKITKFN